jgi:hypothetical protein
MVGVGWDNGVFYAGRRCVYKLVASEEVQLQDHTVPHHRAPTRRAIAAAADLS